MNSHCHTSSSSIGFCGLLTILFITLKLLDKISWSWFWILSPIWIPILIVLTIFLIVIIAIAIGTLFKQKRRKKWQKN